jgi:hypothetical protein
MGDRELVQGLGNQMGDSGCGDDGIVAECAEVMAAAEATAAPGPGADRFGKRQAGAAKAAKRLRLGGAEGEGKEGLPEAIAVVVVDEDAGAEAVAEAMGSRESCQGLGPSGAGHVLRGDWMGDGGCLRNPCI